MRWIVRGLIAVAGLVVLVLAVVYGGSEWVIRKGHAVPEARVAIPTDADRQLVADALSADGNR